MRQNQRHNEIAKTAFRTRLFCDWSRNFQPNCTAHTSARRTAVRNVNGAGEQETNLLYCISVGTWNNFGYSDIPSECRRVAYSWSHF
jgi:hypothetical protein